MTKEALLSNYDKDKIAEICIEFYKKNDELVAQICELNECLDRMQARSVDLDIWDNIEKVFAKLKSIPAEEFIELYSRMKKLIEYPFCSSTVTYSMRQGDSITTLMG